MAPARRPSTVRILASPEAAWLGAMIDGEGSIKWQTKRHFCQAPSVMVYNSDVEIISTCLRLAGDGGILLQPLSQNRVVHSTKPLWEWYLGHVEGIQALLPQVVPYLATKKTKAIDLLELLQQRGRRSNAAKTHCPRGHAYDDANTYRNPKTNWRICRACSGR